MIVDENDSNIRRVGDQLADVDVHLREPKDDDIIVTETGDLHSKVYPWPSDVPRASAGDKSNKPSRVFRTALVAVRKYKPQYEWIPFYKDDSGLNSLSQTPSLMSTLNRVFYDQLSSDYSVAQRLLLEESDVVIVCYDPKLKTILSYGSNRFSVRGSIEGLDAQVSHAGHMIVAAGHEKKQLTPITGALMALYGHTVTDLFREEVIVIRTNNRFVERILGRVPPIYRSDRLTESETEYSRKSIVTAIKWTDRHVFHSKVELIMGQTISIQHRFPEEATIDGVDADQIIYIARMSSMGFYLLRLVKSVVQKSRRR